MSLACSTSRTWRSKSGSDEASDSAAEAFDASAATGGVDPSTTSRGSPAVVGGATGLSVLGGPGTCRPEQVRQSTIDGRRGPRCNRLVVLVGVNQPFRNGANDD